MPAAITHSEYEIMRILWREGHPVTYTQLRGELERKMGWNKSTIQTLITRLRDKGVISAQAQEVLLYSPNVSEQEYLNSEGQDFLDRLFDGNAASFVTTLCQNGNLTEDDIDALKAFFQMEDGGK
ncbi:MAG: BlaI/MecI/CopY family transcriptional regulator [Gracilibacteraceae bacterium]|jgi:predicted transcriptional regulator|nr:BlaI/MecI/CopY family transcriptional regulator [Gracilibacteraceae bacterium]